MKNQSWFSHLEFAVMLVTLIGGFYIIDAKVERLTENQSKRTDRLYEMFYEVVKECKKV